MGRVRHPKPRTHGSVNSNNQTENVRKQVNETKLNKLKGNANMVVCCLCCWKTMPRKQENFEAC